MLMKRTGSVQKEVGQMTKSDSDLYSNLKRQNCRSNSLFSIPGLYVGLNPKGLADADSVRSPTSPLDFLLFPHLSSPMRSPRSPFVGQRKSWDCSKVGLSIIHSLDDNGNLSGRALQSFHTGNILFGPKIAVKNHKCDSNISSIESPKSLPKDYTFSRYAPAKSPLHSSSSINVVFEIADGPIEPDPLGKIRSSSLDSCTIMSYRPRVIRESPKLSKVSGTSLTSIPLSVEPGSRFGDSLSASEIELSEDYTCVISHGSDSKTTHIYGDCILECHPNELSNFVKEIEEDTVLPLTKSSETPLYICDDFLSLCYTCKKPLPEGEDIYIYRGEKAFCSVECRSKEILSDEIEEAVDDYDKSPKSKSGDGLFQSGSFLPS
ncbi:hypothetical protein NL676_033956 [Syzygium grande]|nr:hypothetical protein NL676_033956 [Syzygium grande]